MTKTEFVLVPRIEDDAMCEAGLEALQENLGHSAVIVRDAAACYRAMIAVAPEPQPEVAAEPVISRIPMPPIWGAEYLRQGTRVCLADDVEEALRSPPVVEEAVKADAWDEDACPSCGGSGRYGDAAQRAIDAPFHPEVEEAELRVRELEWLSTDEPFFAASPFCQYRIASVEDDTGRHWETTISYRGSMYRRHETEAEAKAAAQSDFSTRIRSALATPPVVEEAVKAEPHVRATGVVLLDLLDNWMYVTSMTANDRYTAALEAFRSALSSGDAS